jgi:hypothetical protein
MKEMTIEELQERWLLLPNIGAEVLRVTENSQRFGIKSFTVCGLSMDIEDDVATCEDFYDNIMKNNSNLMIFLTTCLKKIFLIPIGNGLYQERLEFENLVILIEKA